MTSWHRGSVKMREQSLPDPVHGLRGQAVAAGADMRGSL